MWIPLAIIVVYKMLRPPPECFTLETKLSLFNPDGHFYNGSWMYALFYVAILTLGTVFGFRKTLTGALIVYLCVLILKDLNLSILKRRTINRTVFYRDVREGDIVLVCRGGEAGKSADVPELFMYHVFGYLGSGSVIGHAGLVFRDTDHRLKVTDVQLNAANNANNGHVITPVNEFVDSGYDGLKVWLRLSRPLTQDESSRLTDAVLDAKDVRHCPDCFSLDKISFEIPTDPTEARKHYDEHGAGCGENIFHILHRAGMVYEIPKRIFPASFLPGGSVKLTNNSYENMGLIREPNV